MKLTKYEHACMIIEVTGERLIIDPGVFTMPLGDIGDVVAVVITHEHADHWTPEQLERIIERNPAVTVFGPAGVVAAASDFAITETHDGDRVEIGPFSLQFFGKDHAVIHESIPMIDNVGVLVNDELYYAGDSYFVPPVPVKTLAAPAGAPWLKVGEAIDYVLAVAPRRAFPVHEMTLSVAGKGMVNQRLDWAAAQGSGSYSVLEPGESLDL
jgi:L-ascorbate metabolism protein UlaG (beta-lactamase superfamily)